MTIIPHQATRLFSVGEITVNYDADPTTKRERVTSSLDAFHIFRQYWSEKINHVEEIYLMCLSRSNEVIGIYLLSTGGISGTVADPKIVFQVVLGCHASSLIIAHNHPSGNLTASQADKDLTRKYKEAGKLLDCTLLDHLILTPAPHAYFSFADEGIL